MISECLQYFCSIGFVIFAVLLVPCSSGADDAGRRGNVVHHDITITLYPKEHRLIAEDLITLPEGYPAEVRFTLHKGLEPSSLTPGVSIIREGERSGHVPVESFRVRLPQDQRSFRLKFGGTLFHSRSSEKPEARGFSQTPGIISEEGIYLAGSSFWYPLFDDLLVTFRLTVQLPPEWDAVSQGERVLHARDEGATRVGWESPEPQEEIFLIAGRFTEYTKPAGSVTAMVFLRAPDKGLAERYLDATARYIPMYEKLIGPYPYKKFALVENFWETGFGMPSFTLLGPRVIRLPFIVNTSYPHEILHNWWGNCVFPDYAEGNWSEGLTAYLADHLMKEQEGSGAEYRETTLQKYADYVLSGRDFPLTQFHSRHSSSSEAVGYGKGLMFFHMLRQDLGDEAFRAGLRDFYGRKKFMNASFDDLRRSFEKVSARSLKTEFSQWVTRTGAPELKVTRAEVRKEEQRYVLSARIEQVQFGEAYHLRVPVAVTLQGQERAYQTTVVMDKKVIDLAMPLPSRPLRFDVDPEFDLFRRLNREEIPPALSQLLGAKKMLIILPSSAEMKMVEAYRDFAVSLANSGPDEVEIRFDKDIDRLPSDRAVTILGWENLFFSQTLAVLSAYDVSMKKGSLLLGKTELQQEDHSFVLVARNPANKEMALTFIASSPLEALPGLARKLPHYHKYSYLGFTGVEPENVAKGRWPVTNSPMTVFLPNDEGVVQRVEMGGLAAREPLIRPEPVFSSDRMMETVRFLSSNRLKGRGFGSRGLDEAAQYIADAFKTAGLKPGGDGDGSYLQIWKEKGGATEDTVTMKNVIGVIPGKKQKFSGQAVVIGAHYDHLGLGWPDVRDENRGKVHPGADDNASGVAVLLELARVLAKGMNPDCSVVFVAFSGEEAGRRGSRHYVSNPKRYAEDGIIGMVNLDTVGRLGKKRLLILGADSAKEWVHIFRGAGFVTGVETETVSERLDSSDQVSFEDSGIPAVQLFTGPHLDYHRTGDTADKIDAQGLVKVASVAKEVIEYLAAREEPLTAAAKTEGNKQAETGKERKVSLGTVPDFSFGGKGCRLSGVVPGSPAETCGLKEGDIIIMVNSVPVVGLKDLSRILKSLVPGSPVSITFMRDGKEMTVETEVKAKER